MNAHVLLNSLNELRKSNKMLGLQIICLLHVRLTSKVLLFVLCYFKNVAMLRQIQSLL